MSGALRGLWATIPAEEERYRPLYARVLGLRFVNPGGVLCFLFFEGAIALAALLALAELVKWWAVLVLPAAVAVMVKLNDLVAAVVIRSAAAVPEQERDRFRRQMEPVVGRARVDWLPHSVPGVVVSTEPVEGEHPAEPAALPAASAALDPAPPAALPGTPAATPQAGTTEPGS
ncbi:hypothetical protein C1I95_25320 [Micromonospora craterilacus]|uniref:Uncharacterized protein n=1 Tax=Micromonospora craterilacus TaxID=1655439 RepID=A0A2W2FAT0_9ACTN|nr:hypothetical protein [Micromonospora craterilacus]PZG12654.1 hypothetical protein C1I95_25320 [Micromonospora craterilacus]